MPNKRYPRDIAFEEAVSDNWAGDLDIAEVPLKNGPLTAFLFFAALAVLVVAGRILFLNFGNSGFYAARAQANLGQVNRMSAPRGIIVDRNGTVIAENESAFSALLDVNAFIKNEQIQEKTLQTARDVLGVAEDEILGTIKERGGEQFTDPIVLASPLTQSQIVKLKAADLPTVRVVSGFERYYPEGPAFASVIGYTSLVNADDLKKNPKLTSQDEIGKMGLEYVYDDDLRGTPGVFVKIRDAQGKILGEQEKSAPQTGKTLKLTIDADLQKYFFNRLQQGLSSLGRVAGAGIAINPENGEVLALINFPAWDNNIFTASGNNAQKREILTSSSRPLFNRAVSGLYNPGSTIKPLVGIAALEEGVISPQREIFSPGYLEIPNPYNPDKPTRYADWRYQGNVNLYSALAQSSNVYFYTVGGGAGDIKGLGITKLRNWWQEFNFGVPTGIDLPGEAKGFLPSPEWKEKTQKRSWLLGDTYNVSIGQGDFLVTPIQLLSYIGAVANGGKIYRPYIVQELNQPKINKDLTGILSQIKEAQKGMRMGVTSPMGTSYRLNDLPFEVAAKTGSAQVKNNTQENAFFVGYAPYQNPKIAILVLIENSKEGSLNAVPIAKDVLSWYYENRLK